MDEYQTEQALRAYERIESAIMTFSEHVPIIDTHEQMQSPALIPFVVDACCLIDSLFRDMTSDPVTVDSKQKHRKDCDISDFAKLHAAALDLPCTRSVMLVSPPTYRMPFQPWQSLSTHGSYSPLSWWQNYNLLKHDRLANLGMGTLGTVIDAACALHQILSRRIDFVPALLRRGWFPIGNFTVDYIIDKATRQGGFTDPAYVVQTRLFATPTGTRQFPEDINELFPGLYVCKTEFLEFLGRSS